MIIASRGHWEHSAQVNIGMGGGGEGMVNLSKKAKCTMTFGQDRRLQVIIKMAKWKQTNV